LLGGGAVPADETIMKQEKFEIYKTRKFEISKPAISKVQEAAELAIDLWRLLSDVLPLEVVRRASEQAKMENRKDDIRRAMQLINNADIPGEIEPDSLESVALRVFGYLFIDALTLKEEMVKCCYGFEIVFFSSGSQFDLEIMVNETVANGPSGASKTADESIHFCRFPALLACPGNNDGETGSVDGVGIDALVESACAQRSVSITIVSRWNRRGIIMAKAVVNETSD